jgi:hypothetical protein
MSRTTFDISITYDEGREESYKVTANYAARKAVEEKVGSPLAILQRIAKQDVRLSDLVTVIHACVQAAGYSVSEDEIGEALNSVGIETSLSTAMPLLFEWMPAPQKKRKSQKRTRSGPA